VDGDFIYVYKGEYNEILNISKSVNLIGSINGNTTLIFKPNSQNDIGQGSEISNINIYGGKVKISGFNIIGYNSINDIYGKGIKISSSHVSIINNSVSGFEYGIFVDRYANENNISYNNLDDNQIGINLLRSQLNMISFNNLSSNERYGMFISSSSNNNYIYHNIFYSNSIGIRIKGSIENDIDANLLNNNYDKGIYVCCGSRDNYFYNNSFFSNTLHADDSYDNFWDKFGYGNYWGDYKERYPNDSINISNGFYEEPYNIPGGDNFDNYPLIFPKIH